MFELGGTAVKYIFFFIKLTILGNKVNAKKVSLICQICFSF